MSLEDDLRKHFTSEQPSAPSAGLGPSAIMRVGEERRKRNRFQSAAAGFVVVTAAVLGVLALPNTGGDRIADGPATPIAAEDIGDLNAARPDQSAATTIAPSFDDAAGSLHPRDYEEPTRAVVETRVTDVAGLTWTVTDPELGWARRLVADETGFYALSTAPGTTWDDADEANGWQVPESIYYSADGINWTAKDLPEGDYASDFGASNGIMYLIGTSASTEDGPVEAWLATSADLGDTWDRVTLSVNQTSPPDGVGEYIWPNTFTNLAVYDGTAVVSISQNYYVDVWNIAPREYRQGDYDIRQTDTGLEVFDYQDIYAVERACEDAWYHYELDTPEDQRDPEFVPEACKDIDNIWNDPVNLVYSATWEELGLEDLGDLSSSEMFLVTDGEAPVAIESPFGPNLEQVQLSATDGGFYATTWGRTTNSPEGWGSTLWTSTDGTSWTEVAAPAGAYEVMPIGSYEGKLIATTYQEEGSETIVLEDGVWRTLDLASALPSLEEGQGDRWIGQGGAGAMGVWLTAQTYYYYEETTPVSESDEFYYDEGINQLDLIYSTDLNNWSVLNLTEILGPDAPESELWINQIVVTEDTVYFTVNGYSNETNETYNAAVIGSR